MSAQEGEQSSSSSASSPLLELRVQKSIRIEIQNMYTRSIASTKQARKIYDILLMGLKLSQPKLLDCILGKEDGGVADQMLEETLDHALLNIMTAAKNLLVEELSSLTLVQVDSIIGTEDAGATATDAPSQVDSIIGMEDSGVTATVAPSQVDSIIGMEDAGVTATVAPSQVDSIIGMEDAGVTATVAPSQVDSIIGMEDAGVTATIPTMIYHDKFFCRKYHLCDCFFCRKYL